MKALLYEPKAQAKRVKIHVPYLAVEWRKAIKQMDSSFFHYEQKLWSVINTPQHMEKLREIFGASLSVVSQKGSKKLPFVELTEVAREALSRMEQKLILKGYSQHTLRNYRQSIIPFFSYFAQRELDQVTRGLTKNNLPIYA